MQTTNEIQTHVVSPSGPVIDQQAIALADDFASKIEIVSGLERLVRLPTQQERNIINRAAGDLFSALRPISYASEMQKRAGEALSAMMAGYPQNIAMENGKLAKMIAFYVTKLREFPQWAIEQACREVDGGTALARKHDIKSSFVPTDKQMIQLCADIVAPLHVARNKMERVLAIKQACGATVMPEQREKMQRMMGGLVRELRMPLERVEQQKTERMAEVAAKSIDNDRHSLLRDYQRYGLEPYYSKSGELVSLPMLLRLGWSIERIDGENVLIKPK